MMRKLAMAMVVSGALGSSFANALGLGEIKMNSGLNQPLDAEVKLLNVGDLSVNQILPNLASHKDFSRVGVERVFFLTGIKFEVELDGQGGAVLHLSTDRIVREPYLNFLVELHWPSGRLLREYTALLDPPLFSEVLPVAVSQAAVAKSVATKPVAKTPSAPAVTYSAPASASLPANSSAQRDGAVRVKKNDTLWGIAKDNRPDRSVTVRQTMMAIQQHNPDAFIRNNINLLKSGQLLRMPDVEEIRRVSSSQANAETSRQNEEWAGKKTIDATQSYDSASADSSTASVEQSGLLKLVAEDADSAGNEVLDSASGGSADGGTGSGLSGNDVADDSSGSSVTNVDNLKKELQDLQRLMTLKQDQLALLQLSQAENEVGAELQSALSDAETLNDEQSQLVDGETVTEMAADNVQAEAVEASVVDDASDEAAAIDQAEAAQAEADADKVAEIEAAAAQEARPEESVLDILNNNPLYIGVMIVVILGALILLGVISRRRNEEQEYPQELQEAIDASENDVELSDEFEDDLMDLDAVAEEASVTSISDAELLGDAADVEPASDSSPTLLEEADIYIAYGRYERAVEILQPAVNDAPENTALRLKLAEIFLASNELASFTQQDADLHAIGDGDALAKLDELKATYADLLAAQPDAIDDVAATEESDEFEYFDFDADQDEASDTDNADSEGDNMLEFSLDDDLALDESEEPQGSADDMDFLVDTDESATKLELAKAYIDMADTEAAQEILNEVVADGSEQQQKEAKKLLENLM